MGKITKLTDSEIKSGNKLIAKFMGGLDEKWRNGGSYAFSYDTHPLGIRPKTGYVWKYEDLKYHLSWDWLMPVRYKIQAIGAHMEIDGTSSLSWSYSPKKTGTFSKGAGGGGGHTVKRDPFDSIFGKFYERNIGDANSAERINRETEILATWDNIVYFIKWLNKVCPHLRNHIHKDEDE